MPGHRHPATAGRVAGRRATDAPGRWDYAWIDTE